MNELIRITPENMDARTTISTELITKNILDSAQYNLAPIDDLCRAEQRDGVVAVIGGGPSLINYLPNLGAYEHVILAGSVHDFVSGVFRHDQNVYAMVCDPDPIMNAYLQYRNPNFEYLIASQCDKSLFELLSDMPKRRIWHASGGEDLNKVFKEGAKLITGGCTIGTRAIGMAMAMGFKKIHLYGFDSCLDNQYSHHAYKFQVPDKESLGNISDIKLGEEPDAPTFRVAGYMLQQIFDFQFIIYHYYEKLDITVFGNGAIAYMMKQAKKLAQEYIKERDNGNPV